MKTWSFKQLNWFSDGLSVMDSYIIKELILPFLFGIGIFTSLGVAIGTGFELVRRVSESGLPIGIALQVLFLRLPEFIVFAFPMAILLSTLMTYSRFSSDSEIIALRSIGIHIYRLIVPAVIFSFLIVNLTFVVNNFVAPAANYQATIILRQALKQTKKAFNDRNILYPEYVKKELPNGDKLTVLARLFYAEEFDGEKMLKVTILDRSQGAVNQIVTANYATWNLEENIWDFYAGTIYLLGADGSYQNLVRFQHQQLALPRAPLDLTKKSRDSKEMTLFQAQESLELAKLSGKDKKIRKLQVRIQEKISLPFVCLVFALIGAAIGVKPQNSTKGTSFGICVGLIFAYYLLSFISSSMGVRGVLPPYLAAWLPNILGLGAAGLLLMNTEN
ncbi:putative permease [Xenococcus sp. PCC 7305]|uniref:LptF/LptG family permease n=1 Tax=Xenococcus sp. PCC 7305 TaxID=102125 RepID=UPI0002ABDBBF|nr:LptF/LptG family permease [Xenococcus sp. PCC 7305]ELS02528.1 putative permease [Xenococcus sp. PCC 7305]